MELQAVIFDMDGVLCLTDEYHYRSWMRVSQVLGIPFGRQENEALRGLTRRRSLEVILKGRALPESQVQKILELKNESFLAQVEAMTPEALLDGVKQLLEELRDAGLKTGVASASRNVQIVLHRLGIYGYIDAYSDGNITTRSKPAPDSFQTTAALLGVNPKECLAVEDSQAGIQAARRAGMCVVGLGPADRVREANATYPDLSKVHLEDLREIYRRWSSAETPATGYQSLSLL
jgi:beta-phosphoglucomutase